MATLSPPLMGLSVTLFTPEREPLSPTGVMMDSVHLQYLFPLVTVLEGGHQIQSNTAAHLFKVCIMFVALYTVYSLY